MEAPAPSRPLKILIVYETVYPDFIGGVEHRNFELGAGLARRGHEVTLAGFCKPLPGIPPRLVVRSLGELGPLYNSAGQRSTRQAIRFAFTVPRIDVSEFDVVETANMPYIHIVPLAIKCRLAGKPLLVTWYEYWDHYWKGYVGRLKAPVYRAIEWMTGQLGTAVTATSLLTRERLAAKRWKGDVELVPCGIHVHAVREAAGVGTPRHGQGAPLIFAGRMLKEKRVDLLLRAVALLAKTRPGVLLTVFGDGPYRETLVRLASELGIADRVDFRGHVETSAEVWRSLGLARVAVQPSEREGFGLFPLEAMAAGLPVVYCESPESAVPELVRDGVEGVCTEPEPKALAVALERLLADGEEWQRLHENALKRASGYDWDEVARRIEETCLRLLPRHREERVAEGGRVDHPADHP
ncbi:MAG TPA: glycosyltransferase family 4 protein [Thermoanaerobaculia bacterium]|nr:glycosyltransferase family 4 protein [Thermoanaerobaculia bacterium]